MSQPITKIIYPKYFDLIFHVMAYLKVNNASDLYDDGYINKISKFKSGFSYDIAPAMNLLQSYYNENFDKLALINFLPYYCGNYDDMKNNFLSCKQFTNEDLQFFVNPFIEILDSESVFFFDYWEKTDKFYTVLKKPTEEKFIRELEKFSFIFNCYKKSCKVLFSYTIPRYGRGFFDDSYFAALVRFPEKPSEFYSSFFQLLHEYTHSFTDNLLNNINMKDGSHNLSEFIVILADYHLIKAADENLVQQYLNWVGKIVNEDFDESKFLNTFYVGGEIKIGFDKLINNILTYK